MTCIVYLIFQPPASPCHARNYLIVSCIDISFCSICSKSVPQLFKAMIRTVYYTSKELQERLFPMKKRTNSSCGVFWCRESSLPHRLKAHLWLLYNRDSLVSWKSKKQDIVVRSNAEQSIKYGCSQSGAYICSTRLGRLHGYKL